MANGDEVYIPEGHQRSLSGKSDVPATIQEEVFPSNDLFSNSSSLTHSTVKVEVGMLSTLSMTFHDFPLFLSVVISPSSSTSLSPIFSFQPVHHDRYNKGCGMCYPVCGMVHIKEPLLLIGKSSPCGSSGIPLSLSEWSFTICPTPYNRN